jgi:hypothetical protein
MGVATATLAAAPTPSTSSTSSSAAPGKGPMTTPRRQTLTGIRTSYKSPLYENVNGHQARRRGSNSVTTPGGSSNRRKSTVTAVNTTPLHVRQQHTPHRTTTTDENNMPPPKPTVRTPASGKRRNGAPGHASADRRKSKRFLTIGYAGEVVGRSPLMERQNIVVTVQRSKSAQTPIGKTTAVVRVRKDKVWFLILKRSVPFVFCKNYFIFRTQPLPATW